MNMIPQWMKDHLAKRPESRKTRIRPYEAKDIPLLVLGAELFVPELPNYAGIEVDPVWLSKMLHNNINNNGYFMAWVIVDEFDLPVGGGAAYCVSGILSPKPVTQDIFLFILPHWRSLENVDKIINAYKAWAIARGAILIQTTSTGGLKTEQIEKLLTRHGFVHVGPIFQYRR